MELQQIVHAVDVRIHHRFLDAKKHLLQTLHNTNLRFIESILKSQTIQYTVKNISNMNYIQLGIH